MKITLVNSYYHPELVGGAEVMTQELAEALVRLGHTVDVICLGRESGFSERLGVRIHRLPVRNLHHPRDRKSALVRAAWAALDTYNAQARELVGMKLKALSPDIVHTHNLRGFSTSIWSIAAAAGSSIVHTAHDYYLICANSSLIRDGRLCAARCSACVVLGRPRIAATRHVDVFCSPSRFLLDLHLKHGLTAKRSLVVRNAIPLGIKRASERDPRPYRFLFIGSLEAHKGIRTLLDAISAFRSHAARFLIAGSGSLAPAVRAAAAADDRISYLGFVEGPRKQELLHACHCLVFPSVWYENGPIALVEAARNGLFVIASNIGGVPEYAPKGSRLVEAGDSAALARAMEDAATGAVAGSDTDPAEQPSVDRYVDIYTRLRQP